VQPAEYDVRRGLGPDDLLVIHGWYGVEADMPSAGTLTATSSAGALDNGLQVRIEGLTNASPGYEQVVTITLAGAGTATTTQTFKAGSGGVRRITIVPGTVPSAGGGVVTVTGGGATIERLDSSREREHHHQRTELHSGGGTGTYTVRYIRRTFNVSAATDVIPVPNEFADLLELGVQIECARLRKAYADAQVMRQEWRERMREFSAWNNRTYAGQRSIQAPRIYSP
jgi:hypothetical protein